jgi:hypothetical protein
MRRIEVLASANERVNARKGDQNHWGLNADPGVDVLYSRLKLTFHWVRLRGGTKKVVKNEYI